MDMKRIFASLIKQGSILDENSKDDMKYFQNFVYFLDSWITINDPVEQLVKKTVKTYYSMGKVPCYSALNGWVVKHSLKGQDYIDFISYIESIKDIAPFFLDEFRKEIEDYTFNITTPDFIKNSIDG
jgi:hypothetical protein